jgi:long-subunit acyl-CoA synthetase (AMP-forming)
LLNASFQCFGGGPLSTEVGDKLVSMGCTLVSLYGGTEFGAIMKYAAVLSWAEKPR